MPNDGILIEFSLIDAVFINVDEKVNGAKVLDLFCKVGNTVI